MPFPIQYELAASAYVIEGEKQEMPACPNMVFMYPIYDSITLLVSSYIL